MKIAIAIGAYELVDFVELNCLCCRHVFGEDVPILVSDDISKTSPEIRDLCERLQVYHIAGGPRGHFAGDHAVAVNGLAFAANQGADVMIKISQRFCFIEPVCKEIIERYFSSDNTLLALPGRIQAHTIKRQESKFFANLSVLTDVLCIRTGSITPEALKLRYEIRIANATNQVDRLIESCWANLMDCEFVGRCVRMPEFSNPFPGRPPLYLRKAQNEPADFELLAMQRGMKSFNANLVEWNRLSPNYRPTPDFQP